MHIPSDCCCPTRNEHRFFAIVPMMSKRFLELGATYHQGIIVTPWNIYFLYDV